MTSIFSATGGGWPGPRCATPLDGVQSDAPPLRREVNDEKPPRPEITMGSQRLD